MRIIYTLPKLCKAKKGWYIYFTYAKKSKRLSLDLNKIKDLAEREYQYNILIELISTKLKNGWNPFVDLRIFESDMLFTEALDFALDKKKNNIAPKSFNGYKSTIGFIKKAQIDLSLEYLEIKEVRRAHIRLFIEKAKNNRNWSNKAFNKNLNYLSAVIDELLHWDIIEVNPVSKIRRLPTEESTANRTPTDKEHVLIKRELQSKDPNFYNFIELEYHTGIRPKEILSIQLNMIDLENSEIRLPPKITKSGTKKRNVVINNHLLDLFLNMNLSMFPKDFYLFGSYREKGQGNRGEYIDFIPAPTPIKRDTATKRWRKLIKDGLGIDVNMYAYKHKGGDDKLRAGVDFESIRHQYGHSESKMTERYVKEVKGVYKKDIIKNSPEF